MKKVFLLLIVALVIISVALPIVAYADDGGGMPIIQVPLPAWAWTLIAIGSIAVLIILLFLILPKILALAQRSGWDVSGFLNKAGIIIKKADTAIEGLVNLGLPVNIVDIILDYTAAGVKYAEQLWHTGQLTGDERNEKAKTAIYAFLKKAGVPDDMINSTEIQELIEIGLEAAVEGLGHSKKKAA